MTVRLWSSIDTTVATVASTTCLYVVVLVAVRLSGRRTLAQISAYDVLVTIAIGSIVATAALPSPAAPSDAVTAVLTLLALQALVSSLRQRYPRLQRLTDFRADVIARNGVIETASSLSSAQLSESDVRSRLRQHGISDLSAIGIVVLEPTGRISVFHPDAAGDLIGDLRSDAGATEGEGERPSPGTARDARRDR